MDLILEIVKAVLSAFPELWRGLCVSGSVIVEACSEVWLHSTKENISRLVAIGVIVYTLPDVHKVLLEALKQNVSNL